MTPACQTRVRRVSDGGADISPIPPNLRLTRADVASGAGTSAATPPVVPGARCARPAPEGFACEGGRRDQNPGRRARRIPQPIERHTHIAIADLLRLACKPGWWWSHIPSGEYRTDKTGALLQRMGLKAGMLDFLLIDSAGVHHWLEIKRGNAPLTYGQAVFIAELTARGVPFHVARSYDAAVKQLKEWGAL